MFKGIPKDIQEAIDKLWSYSEDAMASIVSKEWSEEEGYECSTKEGYHFVFILPKREREDNVTEVMSGIKHKRMED